jgi:TolB-like protein/DNA-binding winged helix-turn-helix (wHTH) protein
METSSAVRQIVRFGSFELNARTGELRKRGIRVMVQEQPLKILEALLEQPGSIVTRRELCRRLWPNGTFVDFEHSLNAAVRRLRLTLGDDADTPTFVETVHRRGYRFLAWEGCGLQQAGVKVDVSPVARSSPARLAVLPFLSLHGERTSAFSEGLAEETVTLMVQLCPPQVGVIARASVMRVMGSPPHVASAAETGRALDADYLLEGSIRGDGTRVRIVAQLIASQDETHLWAAIYDRMITDTLTVQMEVANEIARAVALALNARRPALSREAAS